MIYMGFIVSLNKCNAYHGSFNRREPVFMLDLFLSKKNIPWRDGSLVKKAEQRMR